MQYRDTIDISQPQKMLNKIAIRVLEISKPKSNYIDSFQSPKLPLSPKKSVYEDSYRNRDNYNTLKISYEDQKRKLGRVIDESLYKASYVNKSSQLVNITSGKKMDNLKLDGPLYSDTTYRKQYPKLKIKPIKETLFINPQNIHPINTKVDSISSYTRSYKGNSCKRTIPIKNNTSLKINGDFIGASTYKQEYRTMQINKLQSFSPKNIYNPSLSYVVPSSYQNDFNLKKNTKEEFKQSKPKLKKNNL